jgi:hypothetical protein
MHTIAASHLISAFMRRVGRGIGMVSLALTVLLSNFTLQAPAVPVSAAGAVNMALSPASKTINKNQLVSVSVVVQAGSQPVDGVHVSLAFDPAFLKVVQVINTHSFAYPLLSTFDNTAGSVEFAAGNLTAPFPSGTFTPVVVQFQSLASTTSSMISFNSLPSKTEITYGGSSVLAAATGGSSITVPDKDYYYLSMVHKTAVFSLSGQISDQNSKPVSGVVVKLDNGASATSGIDGVYTFASVNAGSYSVTPQNISGRYAYTPASQLVALSANVTNLNFQALPATGEYILNGGFESVSDWEITATPILAVYTASGQHTGLKSMQAGLLSGMTNSAGYTKFRQMVPIPNQVAGAKLTFWMKPTSTDTSNSDFQYVYVAGLNGNTLDYLVSAQARNDESWIKYSFDLSKYAGQYIKIVFAVYNDGSGGITGMLIDDVSLNVTLP